MRDVPKTGLDADIEKVHRLIAENVKTIEFYANHDIGHLWNPLYLSQIRPVITVPGLTALYRLAKRVAQEPHVVLRSDKTAQIFEDKQIQELIKRPAVSKFIADKITAQILSPDPTDPELVNSILALSRNTLKQAYENHSLMNLTRAYAPIFKRVAENVLKQVLLQKLHGAEPLKATFIPSLYADMPDFVAPDTAQAPKRAKFSNESKSSKNASKAFQMLSARFGRTQAFQSMAPIKIPEQSDRDKEAVILLAFLYTIAHILTPQKALAPQLIQEHDANTVSPNKTPAAFKGPGKGPMLD